MKFRFILLFLLGINFVIAQDLSQEELAAREKILNNYGSEKKLGRAELKQKIQETIQRIQVKHNVIHKRIEQTIEAIPTLSAEDMHPTFKKALEKQQEVETAKYRNLLKTSSVLFLDFQNASESTPTENLRNLFQSLNTHEKNIEAAVQKRASVQDIGNLEEGNQELVKSLTESIEGRKLDDNLITGLLGNNTKAAVKLMIKDNPFSRLSKNELKDLFGEKLGGSPLGKFLKSNPKALNLFVEICHDKEAIPKFISIVNETKRLKQYGYSFIGVFAIIILIGFITAKRGILSKLFIKLFLMLTSAVLNFGIFYIIFKEELTPMINIISRHW